MRPEYVSCKVMTLESNTCNQARRELCNTEVESIEAEVEELGDVADLEKQKKEHQAIVKTLRDELNKLRVRLSITSYQRVLIVFF